MGVDAIDQTIYPSVLGMTKCSIAFGRWPHAIEYLVIHSTSGQLRFTCHPGNITSCGIFSPLKFPYVSYIAR